MARVEKLRLLYLVAFLCFCVILACFYGDTTRYVRRTSNTKFSKFNKKFEAMYLNAKYDLPFKRVKYVSSSTEHAKQDDGRVEMKELKLAIRNGKLKCGFLRFSKWKYLIFNFFSRKFNDNTSQ